MMIKVRFPEGVREIEGRMAAHSYNAIEGTPIPTPARPEPLPRQGWRFVETVGGDWYAVEETWSS